MNIGRKLNLKYLPQHQQEFQRGRSMDEEEKKGISNAELCAMWLNDEIPLSEYMRRFKESEEHKDEV